jgi:hypothetical protein
MKQLFRTALLGALIYLLLSAGCSPRKPGTTAAEATVLAAAKTGLPFGTETQIMAGAGTGTALTPLADQTEVIPATGGGAASVLCQFCVDDVAHALLVLPPDATFNMVSASETTAAAGTGALCNSIETLNGKQVVLCYGGAPSTIHLNVCLNNGSCSDFPVSLELCSPARAHTQEPPALSPAPATPTPVPATEEPTSTAETVVPPATPTP